MIIVASSGYAFKDNEYPVFFPGDFDSELVNSIIPYIEEILRSKKEETTVLWQDFHLVQDRLRI
mgnify:FL=1